MPVHTHRLVSDDGVSEITITEQDYDRRWLQRQRLLDEPVVIAYGGYTPISRATVSIEPGGVAYLGYCYEDASDCAICREEHL